MKVSNMRADLSALFLGLCLACGFSGAAAAEINLTTKRAPNIIIILADDLGFDDVSFRGASEFLTPNIDALAYHGRLLDRLYAPSICTPSRSALLTGRYPIHTGTQHFVISNAEPWALPSNVTTMAEIFQSAGYSTNLIGKWHLGHSRPEYTPTRRGFDYHYGYWGAYIDYYHRRVQMPIGNTSMGYDFRRNMQLECADPGIYVTDLLTNEAERIIVKQPQEQPLFLMVSHLATHAGSKENPLQAPEEEIRKFAYIKDPKRRIFAAMVSRLDQSVGRIVSALERTNQLEQSIILFYSDNGAPVTDLFANSGSNWPLKGQKNTPWEGGVRVAGAIWSNTFQAKGSIFKQSVYVGDWLPTLAHAASIKIPLEQLEEIDGIDLWPELDGDSELPLRQREILHNLDPIWHINSLQLAQWKYVNGTSSAGQYDRLLSYRELYDLDPRERRYVLEVRNSAVSRALARYDWQRLSRRRIETLRQEAAVQCSDMQHGCNSLIEECLYDLNVDPCERNNLAHSKKNADVLQMLRGRVQHLRESAWPIGNRPGSPQGDPSVHDCTWTNFETEEPKSFQQCHSEGPPCLEE